MIQTANEFRKGKAFKTSTDFASAYGKYIAECKDKDFLIILNRLKEAVIDKGCCGNAELIGSIIWTSLSEINNIQQASNEIINQIK